MRLETAFQPSDLISMDFFFLRCQRQYKERFQDQYVMQMDDARLGAGGCTQCIISEENQEAH